MNNKDAAPVASGALETIEGYYLKCFNEIDIAHKFKIHKFFFFFFNNLHQFSCCTLLPNADWNSNSRHSYGSES